MSAFQGGTSSGYQSIAPYRLYLDLSGDDKDFVSNVQNPLIFTEELNTSQQTYLSINSFQTNINSKTSSYSLISQNPLTKLFSKFIDFYNLKSQMNDEFTLFVPIDSFMSTISYKIQTSPLNGLDIFNFHKLDYILTPVEIINLSTKLKTKYLDQTIFIRNMNIIINKESPNRILKSIQTDNGYIYIIERPLIPYLY
jgi:hypothetical protein